MLRILSLCCLLGLFGCAASSVRAPVEPLTMRVNGVYHVQKGDTLAKIAQRYGWDYHELAKLNHISPPYELHRGQVLRFQPPQRYRVETIKESGSHHAPVVRRVLVKEEPRRKQTLKPLNVARARPNVSPALKKGLWQWPTQGKIIETYKLSKDKKNNGIDIKAPKGHAVVASRGGTVVYAGNGLKGYGNLVIIKHTNDFLSAYAHNQSILVNEGMSVKAGQKIAEIGSSGTDQAKLHFEIRYLGKPVDPLRYLPMEQG